MKPALLGASVPLWLLQSRCRNRARWSELGARLLLSVTRLRPRSLGSGLFPHHGWD